MVFTNKLCINLFKSCLLLKTLHPLQDGSEGIIFPVGSKYTDGFPRDFAMTAVVESGFDIVKNEFFITLSGATLSSISNTECLYLANSDSTP